MVQRVATVAFEGIEARAVDVQVPVAPGLPAFNVVGLPDKAVSEARERVRAALVASGLALPARRITVNLAPADVPKEGSHYDLPIALGLMAAIGAIPADALSGFTVLGELGLDGSIAAVAGVLPAAIGANARGEGLSCPAACGPKPRGRARKWRSSPPRPSFSSPIISAARRCSPVRSRRSAKSTARWSTSRTSRARRAPSARSRSPPPAATICSCYLLDGNRRLLWLVVWSAGHPLLGIRTGAHHAFRCCREPASQHFAYSCECGAHLAPWHPARSFHTAILEQQNLVWLFLLLTLAVSNTTGQWPNLMPYLARAQFEGVRFGP